MRNEEKNEVFQGVLLGSSNRKKERHEVYLSLYAGGYTWNSEKKKAERAPPFVGPIAWHPEQVGGIKALEARLSSTHPDWLRLVRFVELKKTETVISKRLLANLRALANGTLDVERKKSRR